jgi:hypothetical protein
MVGALTLALLIAQDKPARPSHAEIDKAIDQGAEYLKKTQQPDGSWPMGPEDVALHAYKNHMGPQAIGHTALNLLALLVADVDPDDPAIARAFKFLADRRAEFGHTYNCGLTLMAIEAHAEKKMKRDPGSKGHKPAMFKRLPRTEIALAEELTRRLVLGQIADGSWKYEARQGELGTGTQKMIVDPQQDPRQQPPQQPQLPPGFPQPGQPPPQLPPGVPQPGQQPQGGQLPPGFAPGGLPGITPPDIGGDLSNTQYALLGLRAAAELGIKFDQEAWFKALNCFLDRQEKSGAKVKPFDVPAATGSMWEGRPGRPAPKSTRSRPRDEFEARGWGYVTQAARPQAYGAMTCIGVASTVLCKYYLRGHKQFKGEQSDRTDRAIEDGCAWIAANFDVKDNARWQDPMVPYKNAPPKIDGYYMYGVERAGVLAGVDLFGDRDWYAEGARVLIDRQQPDGSWSSEMFYEPKPTISTSFAILFLKRATEPVIPTGDEPKK